MRVHIGTRLLSWFGFSSALWLALASTPAAPCAAPSPAPPPCTQPAPATPAEPGTTPQNETTPESAPTSTEPPPDLATAHPPAGQGKTVAMHMLGNQLAISALAFMPGVAPNPFADGAVTVPTVRAFRISENESPQPQDRVYLNFNYFDDVNGSINRRLEADLSNITVHREILGMEKTFLDGDASVGFRLPLDTLRADSTTPGLNGSTTDFGDLSLIAKYAFWHHRDSGSLLSGGLALTLPTGPHGFAGSRITSFHNTLLQPYVGYIWGLGDFYIHGFAAVDVPTDPNDVTFLFNDVGVGYHLYRGRGKGRVITGVVPTVEIHISDPVNHRGAFNPLDPAGAFDFVDMTAGVTVEFNRSSTLALGVISPVTGPKPFNYGLLAQFNVRFGGGSLVQALTGSGN